MIRIRLIDEEEPPWDPDDAWADRTVRELRDYVWAHRADVHPIVCPGCYGKAKRYVRRIYRGFVKALLGLYQSYPEYGHLPSVDPTKGDAAKMVHWGLIEEERVRRVDGGRAGWWRITGNGRLFLFGGLQVQRNAVFFQDYLLRLDGPLVGVQECYGEDFDLEEMLNSG